MEIFAFLGNLFLLSFNWYQNYKVQKLQKLGVKKIERYIMLLDPPEEDDDDDEAAKAEKDALKSIRIGADQRMKDINAKKRKKFEKEEKKARD